MPAFFSRLPRSVPRRWFLTTYKAARVVWQYCAVLKPKVWSVSTLRQCLVFVSREFRLLPKVTCIYTDMQPPNGAWAEAWKWAQELCEGGRNFLMVHLNGPPWFNYRWEYAASYREHRMWESDMEKLWESRSATAKLLGRDDDTEYWKQEWERKQQRSGKRKAGWEEEEEEEEQGE